MSAECLFDVTGVPDTSDCPAEKARQLLRKALPDDVWYFAGFWEFLSGVKAGVPFHDHLLRHGEGEGNSGCIPRQRFSPGGSVQRGQYQHLGIGIRRIAVLIGMRISVEPDDVSTTDDKGICRQMPLIKIVEGMDGLAIEMVRPSGW